MIVKTTDYKKIAKQKQLAFEIDDLQTQRLSLLANLRDLRGTEFLCFFY